MPQRRIMNKVLKILIADDHPIVREGLVSLISSSVDMIVSSAVSNGREAVEQYFKHLPDVTLMDLRMPEMDGVDAITAIRMQIPTARIIVLTTFADDENIFLSFRAGARAYLLKDTPRAELLACIREVADGQKIIPPVIAAKLAERMTNFTLSPRELEVLTLMVDGNTNKEIAEKLFVAEGTVKSHVVAVLRKLDVTDRTQAVIIAVKRGIVRLE